MMHLGDILSTVGDIMINMRDILSTLRGVQYRGDIILCNLSTVGGYHDTCGDIMSTVGVFSTVGALKQQRIFPHSTEHPPGYSWYPHVDHDIPHGTEYPPQYSR